VSATGAVRVGKHRTGMLRTGTHRTGVVRGGAGRTTTAARTVPQRAGTPRPAPARSVPVRPDLRLVPATAPARGRRTRTRSTRAPYVLLILAMLIGTTLSLLVLNTTIAVDSLRATTLRQENAQRAQEVQRLQQQVVDGSTPQRLAGEATSAGLVPAGAAGYLVVEPDGTSTLRGTPSPAPAPPSPSPSPTSGQPAPAQPDPAQPAPAQSDPAAGD
jgi:cell division protein FtsL